MFNPLNKYFFWNVITGYYLQRTLTTRRVNGKRKNPYKTVLIVSEILFFHFVDTSSDCFFQLRVFPVYKFKTKIIPVRISTEYPK